MESIITIKGNVKHTITLDPTVWIFDDRKVDLDTFFTEEYVEKDEEEEYKRSMGKHWSREIMEGATFPPTLKTEKKFDRRKMVTGTFGISLDHFVKECSSGGRCKNNHIFDDGRNEGNVPCFRNRQFPIQIQPGWQAVDRRRTCPSSVKGWFEH